MLEAEVGIERLAGLNNASSLGAPFSLVSVFLRSIGRLLADCQRLVRELHTPPDR
jgi:hypothetical protein